MKIFSSEKFGTIHLICLLILFIPIQARSEEQPSKVDQAIALYEEGPSKAPEVIRLLEEALKENPKNQKAMSLLGMTYFSIGEFEKALEQFDRAIARAKKRNDVAYEIMFYKARTLHELGLNGEAKSVLDACWPFFQEEDALWIQYKMLYSAVEAELEKKK